MISTPGPTLSRFRFALVVPAVILVTATACGSKVTRTPDSNTTTPEGPSVQKLAGKVSDGRAMKHLQAMQKIADQHGGNRAAGTSGYDASVEYVVDVLRDSGFKISTPTFESSGANGEGAGESQRSVIAQTQTGDPGQVVMIGAHLDSVEDGPGIVDNGSGVASLLEIATQLGAKPAVHNTVRFAFFGDEESGAVARPPTWRGCPTATARKSSCT
jgi:aminopeptidase S